MLILTNSKLTGSQSSTCLSERTPRQLPVYSHPPPGHGRHRAPASPRERRDSCHAVRSCHSCRGHSHNPRVGTRPQSFAHLRRHTSLTSCGLHVATPHYPSTPTQPTLSMPGACRRGTALIRLASSAPHVTLSLSRSLMRGHTQRGSHQAHREGSPAISCSLIPQNLSPTL